MKVSVVILNYNGEKHLRSYLPSVADTCPSWAEIVVADNGSSDGSESFVRSVFPKIRFLNLGHNHGFAGGYNRALRQIHSEYYVLLNNDVEVSKNWIELLVNLMDTRQEVSAAQPKILDFSSKDHFEYAGACGGFIDTYGFPFCRGRIFNLCERDTGQYDQEREVFWATGACMIIRSSAFWKVNGFDETLFAHMEEIDLCWRLKNLGHRIYCFPQVTVYHLGGGTLASRNPRKTFLNFRNSLLIYVKNDHRKYLLLRILKRLILDGAAACYMLFNSGWRHFTAVAKAHFSFYLRLGAVLPERRRQMAQSAPYNATGFFNAGIAATFYLKGQKHFKDLDSLCFLSFNPAESEEQAGNHESQNR